MIYDVAVIGAGASGIIAALEAAKNNNKVIIIDKNPKSGKKLYATGNGKCNVGNLNTNFSDYFSDEKELECFMTNYIIRNPHGFLIDYFSELGMFIYNKNNYLYPISNQASSVMWCLNDALEKHSITRSYSNEITSVHKSNCLFKLLGLNGLIEARNVILATGGESYKTLGGSDKGFYLAKKLNLKIMTTYPALVPLVVKDSDFNSIAGVRSKAKVKLYINSLKKEPIAEEEGELQVTDYGVSGIMIFNISGQCVKALNDNLKVYLSVSLIDENLYRNIYKEISIDKTKFNNRTINGFLNLFINDKLVNYILNKLGYSKKLFSELSFEEINDILVCFMNWQFEIVGSKGFEMAQVTGGGVLLSEINSKTFETKNIPGLYVVGEALNVYGKCGGYNLMWAFYSGYTAGRFIREKG